MFCQGNCGNEGMPEHQGVPREVHVYGSGKDWGTFIYCDTAILEDRNRGLKVEELEGKENENA
jgi:hypothetical protein